MSISEHSYFTSLVTELSRNTARAVISKFGPVSDQLNAHLHERLERGAGEPGGFLADPVFEAGFGWQPSEVTMKSLAGNLLDSRLVSAMDRPPESLKEQRFNAELSPYRHQLESWRILAGTDAKSIVVTSGTGSGKTECFLVPILDSLARQTDTRSKLIGVQALLLYPLNALINSQRDRLRAWTHDFHGSVRFALYNGETREHVKAPEQNAKPEEILSRKLLREEPPPILVTNATMLEYMLVRQEDHGILEKSRGKLRWIVLDEAHTYVGSNAAEIALLLRRVLHAFGVESDKVHFIATSATIGEAGNDLNRVKLQRYLADIAGVDPSRVTVIEGAREIPKLPAGFLKKSDPLPALSVLQEMAPDERFAALASTPRIRALRDAMVTRGALTLTELAGVFTGKSSQGGIDPADRMTMLQTLDICRSSNFEGENLLPLRAHLFQRVQSGLWACCDKTCSGRTGTALDSTQWPFGKVFFERRDICNEPGCQGKVFDLVFCDTCGAEYLAAEEYLQGDAWHLRARSFETGDDDLDEDSLIEEEGDTPEELSREVSSESTYLRLITGAASVNVPTVVDLVTGQVDPVAGGNAIGLIQSEADLLQCNRCKQKEKRSGELFRPARTSSALHLLISIPTLLAHTAPAAGNSQALPSGGRRLITFSDSRQGTARFSLQSQLDAERNYVRSWLYHQIHANLTHNDPEKIEQTRQTIAALEPLAAVNPALTQALEDQKRLLAAYEATPVARLSWHESAQKLAGTKEISEWMPEHWRHTELGSMAAFERARFSLLREFARRPKRQNSLESLGLLSLHYPALDQIREADLPPAWKQRSLPLQEWKNFLKIALDFFARGSSAVQVPQEFHRWIGTTIKPRFIIAPENATAAKHQVRWHMVRGGKPTSRLPVLLFRALGLSWEDREDRATVNDLLHAAWLQVRPLLESVQEGFQLNLEKQVALSALTDAWVCPVTRRVLDVTLLGWTPYLTLEVPEKHAKCEKIVLPGLSYPFGRDQVGLEVDRDRISALIESDPAIEALRSRGVWTSYSDRIASFSPYFRVGEHSAQQSGKRLGELEDNFKSNRLNILSCSTTMEMGVDIGGVSAVAMNNAPPGPANYLQRAGRAGRRKETAAVSLTLCQSAPHGEAVFANPVWPFRTPIHLPQVSLQSGRIVQRHVNAMALTRFLQIQAADLIRLNCGWFFLADQVETLAPADKMIVWLRDPGTLAADLPFMDGLRRLVQRSALFGVNPVRLLDRVAIELLRVAKRWQTEEVDLSAELALAGGPPLQGLATPAQLAINKQLQRFRGEYLLGELASNGFLPGYGFPTTVVPFVNSTLDQLRRDRRKEEKAEREDSPARRQGYPSRDLPMAIRDYAPGTDIVIDGQVYTSEGVTLHWHVPPGDRESAPEIQSFRHAWRCRKCGASGTRATSPEACSICGATGGDLDRRPYLQPSGFAVGIMAKPHNDLSYHQYVPVRKPWITAGLAPWAPLPQPELGRYRFSSEGHIFHRSGGSNGHGFAICLRCGRSASEQVGDGTQLPFQMNEHYRLRGGKEANGESRCQGNDQSWAIKRNQWLGVATSTDVFELQLNDLNSGGAANDERAVYSVAVALRRALAEELGITDREIGCAAVPSRTMSGSAARSIVLYDTASGGAGFVTEAPSMLPKLVSRAQEILRCKKDCDTACHACLLAYDTQHEASKLDRKRALSLLSDHLIEGFQLPPELHYFGSDSLLEYDELSLALAREMQRADAEELRVYLGGDPELWDIVQWPLRSALMRWASEGRQIVLLAAEGVLAQLNEAVVNPLASLLEASGIELRLFTGGSAFAEVPTVIAEISGKSRSVRWATSMDSSQAPGEFWGRSDETGRCVRVTSKKALAARTGSVVNPAGLRLAPAGTFREILVRNELDGPVESLGDRFWALTASQVPLLKSRLDKRSPLTSITYRDRYLCSPLSARLVAEVLRGLAKYAGAMELPPDITIETVYLNSTYGKLARSISHDWIQRDDRNSVIQALLNKGGCQTKVVELKRNESHHARELVLKWTDGAQWTLRLDHGLGFLRSAGEVAFDFESEAEKQAELLDTSSFILKNGPGPGTYLYLTDVS